MIALVTIAAIQYGENAMAQPRGGNPTEDPFSEDISGQPAAQPDDNPFDPFDAPTVQPRARSDDTSPVALKSNSRASSDLDKQLFRVAQEAYVASLAAFRTGKITDPEVVYRWSLRLMKAEQAAGEGPAAPAAKQHLRRMSELADLVNRHPSAGPAADGNDNDLHRVAVEFYRREAESLLDTTTKPSDLAPLSPDDAVEAAETYLGAVLEGNYDEATELAFPGSLATSKRLMDTIKGLISNKSISVLAIQNSGRRTTVLMQEAPSPADASDGRARAQFTVALEPKGGRWLVSTFSVHKSQRSQNRNVIGTSTPPATEKTTSRLPGDSDPFGTPPDAGPRETKVIILKYAQANNLAGTIGNLLRATGPGDFAIAVDERTNRMILRGTSERIAEILALIEQLDIPGPERNSTTDDPAGHGLVQPPGGNYGGAR
jgi:hypothetical protein